MDLNKDDIDRVDDDVSCLSIVEVNDKVGGDGIQPGREQEYHPHSRLIMETFGLHQGVWLPSVERMQEAYDKANEVLSADHPPEIMTTLYTGLGEDQIPSSAALTREATQACEGTTLTSLYFSDILSAEYYRGAVLPDKDELDFTIPGTPLAQQMHVHWLIRAFFNTDGCEDNEQMINPFIKRRHDAKLVEVLCWTILKQCIMRARTEKPLLTAYEPGKLRQFVEVKTFAQRFDEIVKSLRRSKTICKHLYDCPYIHVFVDDPVRAVRRVNANRDLNRQKGQVMGKGKKVIEQEMKAAGAQTPESSRRKRRVNTKESPGSGKRTRRETKTSGVTVAPMPAAMPAPMPATSSTQPPSTPAGHHIGGYTGLMVTPTSTVLDTQSSPLARMGLKTKDESPGQMVSPFLLPPVQSWPYPQTLMSPPPAYGSGGGGAGGSSSYNPAETYAYGNEAYSAYSSYEQGGISGGLGMADLQGNMTTLYQPSPTGYSLQDVFTTGPAPLFTQPGAVTSVPMTASRALKIQELCGGSGILRHTGVTPNPSPLRGFHVTGMGGEMDPFVNDGHEQQEIDPANLHPGGGHSGFGGAEGGRARFG
ncbi:hypothetical protein DV735_g178, partial [Chaetothyriales sp. CBS 134920]